MTSAFSLNLLHPGYFPLNSNNYPLHDIDKYDMILVGNKAHEYNGIFINIYAPPYSKNSTGGFGRIGEYNNGLYRVKDHYNYKRDIAEELMQVFIQGSAKGFQINEDFIDYYNMRVD